MVIEGGCRCGGVRFQLEVEAMPPVYCCHCLNCQTWSGSAFTEQALIPESQITVIAGEPELYVNITASGAESVQRLCGTCHTRLWSTNPARAGVALVRAGSLDASAELAPRAHIWTKRMQPWLSIDDNIPSWPENAPPADFIAALLKG
ncbi:MAG: aldehyde-activating protein [Novosphingobium sp.]|nr:aldehyde-activating protein [Novosphingobium sp.]MBX9643841.1 GFA family protein [Novosphingobium sp.]